MDAKTPVAQLGGKRLPARLLVVIVLGSIVLSAVALAWWVVTVRDQKWARLLARIAELRRELPGTQLPRIPLGRKLRAGNAWDEYLRLFDDEKLSPIPEDIGKRLEKLDPEAARALITEYSPWIDKIRRAARMEAAEAPPVRVLSGESVLVEPWRCQLDETITLCIAESRQMAKAGNLAGALDLLMDVCLCCRDLAGTRLLNSRVYGFEPMGRALREFQDLSTRLDPGLLSSLDRQLSLYDDYFPDPHREPLDVLLKTGELLLREDEVGQSSFDSRLELIPRHWRFFYSTRLEAAATFVTADRLIQDALRIQKLSWAPAEQSFLGWLKESEDLHLPAISYLGLQVDVISSRETRTYLRMLRIAVHYQLTGEIPSIDNSQGEPIKTKRTDDSLLIWNEHLPRAEDAPHPVHRYVHAEYLIEILTRH